LGKFLFRKPSQLEDTFGSYLRVVDKGETLCKSGSPRCRFRSYCMNLDTKGEFSPRRRK
jgi:hypothetical protein